MCIICNMQNEEGVTTATSFLTSFAASRREMQQAAEVMLQCSREAATPDSRRRYDATHKRMVRLIREWNRLEHFREKK